MSPTTTTQAEQDESTTTQEDNDETTPLLPRSPRPSPPSPLHLALPLFLAMFSYSLSTVPTQQFILMYLCQGYMPHSGTDYESVDSLPDFAKCSAIPQVQALAAKWSMILTLATALPSLLSVPLLGALSDHIGRKPIFFMPILSGLIGALAIIAMADFGVSIWILALVHVLQGCLGGFTAIMMVTYAYLADTTSASNRSRVFISIEALIFVAFTLGPFSGGLLTRVLPSGVVGPLYLTVGGKLITLLYVALLLPESRPPAALTHESRAKPPLLSSLVSLGTLMRTMSSPPAMYLLFILFIIAVCIGGMPMMFYYASFRFGWDSYDEGLYMLYMSVTRMFWMLGVGRTLHRIVAGEQVGTSDDQGMVTRKTRVDVNVIRIGMLVLGFGYVGLGFATKAWMLYAITLFTGVGTLAKPTLRSLLSRSTTTTSQGRLFSFINVIDNVAVIIAQLVLTPIFAASVGSHTPGLFLVILGGLFFVAAIVACGFIRVDDVVTSFNEEAGGEVDVSVVVAGGAENVSGESNANIV